MTPSNGIVIPNRFCFQELSTAEVLHRGAIIGAWSNRRDSRSMRRRLIRRHSRGAERPNSRPWQLDEKTRRAARKGLEDARRALEDSTRRPADAA